MTSDASAFQGDGHLWPTAEQTLLLRAACYQDARAREAFAAWRAAIDVEREFDWQMVRLLPAVYANLQRLGETDALMARLKGVYRRAFVESHRVMQRAEQVAGALVAEDIPVMVLKGAAMILAYYPSHAQRPMSDVDLAVPVEHAPRAIAILRERGWLPTAPVSAERIRWFHALQFVHPDGGELDLHWHIMVETTSGDGDAELWRSSESASLGAVPVRVLAPTEMLFHTVLHGVRWNDATPIRWVIDATRILAQRSAEIDWARFDQLAEQLRVSRRVRLGLEFLVRALDASIPESVIGSLARRRPSWRERWESTVTLSGLGERPQSAGQYYQAMLADYSRVAGSDRDVLSLLWDFPYYVCFRLELKGRRYLLGVLLRGIAHRLRFSGSPGAAATRSVQT